MAPIHGKDRATCLQRHHRPWQGRTIQAEYTRGSGMPTTWVNRHLHLIPWRLGSEVQFCTCYGLRYVHGPVTIGRLTGPGVPKGRPGLLLSAYHAGS